jgi:hypothetical protein
LATVLVLSTAPINPGQRMHAATAAASEQVAKQRSKKSSTRLSLERHALSGVAVLDLSEVAARAIGFHYAGLTQVSAVVVESPS